MENKSNDEYLTHYGIPGMKWGHRKNNQYYDSYKKKAIDRVNKRSLSELGSIGDVMFIANDYAATKPSTYTSRAKTTKNKKLKKRYELAGKMAKQIISTSNKEISAIKKLTPSDIDSEIKMKGRMALKGILKFKLPEERQSDYENYLTEKRINQKIKYLSDREMRILNDDIM